MQRDSVQAGRTLCVGAQSSTEPELTLTRGSTLFQHFKTGKHERIQPPLKEAEEGSGTPNYMQQFLAGKHPCICPFHTAVINTTILGVIYMIRLFLKDGFYNYPKQKWKVRAEKARQRQQWPWTTFCVSTHITSKPNETDLLLRDTATFLSFQHELRVNSLKWTTHIFQLSTSNP